MSILPLCPSNFVNPNYQIWANLITAFSSHSQNLEVILHFLFFLLLQMSKVIIQVGEIYGNIENPILKDKLHYWSLTFTQVARLVPNVYPSCAFGPQRLK